MVSRTASLVICSDYEMPSTLQKHLISTAWIFLCSSAGSDHVSHAYNKIDRTNACSSFSLVERWMFLSLHIGFSFTSAVVCATLARNLVFEPSSLRISPRYLNWFTVAGSWPLTVVFVSIGFMLFVISFVFSALNSMPYLEDVLSRRFTRLASSCSSPASPSMSSANRRFVMTRPAMLTVPWCSSRVSVIMRASKMLNKVGERR